MSPNQVDEMFRLLTTVVSTVQRIEQEQTEMRQDIAQLKKGQDDLQHGHEKLRQGQEELRQGQDDLRAEFNQFREETRESFNKLSGQERIEVRKVKMLNDDVLETKAKVEDLIERVEKIEEKQAA